MSISCLSIVFRSTSTLRATFGSIASTILLTLLTCTVPIIEGRLLYPLASIQSNPNDEEDDSDSSKSSLLDLRFKGNPNPEEEELDWCKNSHIADGTKECRFKGVVQHKNGHWGAQIYANHQRVWLGTFKTEMEAAKAYDRAAIKLRSDDSHRNLYSSPQEESLEFEFQRSRSQEDVINMIKDGSYQACMVEFERSAQLHCNNEDKNMEENRNGSCMTKLFEKKLTPSDVGKLNRLVIPKKCALKFHQRLAELGCTKGGDETTVGFVDGEKKRWEFRFCYWKSSQSFAFTKGWNKFVRGKRLKVDDVVVFYFCIAANEKPFFAIDVRNMSPSMENLKVVQEKGKRKTSFRLFGMDIPC